MNAKDFTFGIEIECYVPSNVGIIPGQYHRGNAIPGFPNGWTAQSDGSLGGMHRGLCAVEIVSPILKGEEGIKQVLEVVTKLNAMGAKVNRRCGFHVHVGFCNNDRMFTSSDLRRVVFYVANMEKAIFASTGTKAREMGSYCRSIKPWENSLNYNASLRELGSAAMDRYHVLNVSNLVSGGKPTVEFRAFAGTLNRDKILTHISMCLGLIERALTAKSVPQWTAKTPVETSPIHRSGIGQTELTRLFYLLGWTKGRAPQTYGIISVEGAPSIKQMKKTAMKLAKKYDAQ